MCHLTLLEQRISSSLDATRAVVAILHCLPNTIRFFTSVISFLLSSDSGASDSTQTKICLDDIE